MADIAPATRQALTNALGSVTVAIRPEHEAARMSDPVTGLLVYPDEVADAVFDHLDAAFRETLQRQPIALAAPLEEDAELAIIALIVDYFGRLADTDPAAPLRVLTWARDRYGEA